MGSCGEEKKTKKDEKQQTTDMDKIGEKDFINPKEETPKERLKSTPKQKRNYNKIIILSDKHKIIIILLIYKYN